MADDYVMFAEAVAPPRRCSKCSRPALPDARMCRHCRERNRRDVAKHQSRRRLQEGCAQGSVSRSEAAAGYARKFYVLPFAPLGYGRTFAATDAVTVAGPLCSGDAEAFARWVRTVLLPRVHADHPGIRLRVELRP